MFVPMDRPQSCEQPPKPPSAMRPRQKDRHLPPCVYHRHGAFYLVKRGKWTRLADEYHAALIVYARIVAQPADGMVRLIDDMLPRILKGKSASTVAQYTVAANRLRSILAEFRPDQVRPADVAQIRRSLADTPAVANRTVTVLRLIFDQALEDRLVESHPCAGIRPIPIPARDRLLTWAEFDAIQSKAPERLRIMMDLCYLTGQRIGDVLAIKRADLTDDGIAFRQQKTGKRLIVAWTPELRAAVERAKALTPGFVPLTLFYGKAGKPPAYKNIWRQWRGACEAAGVENANIHDLRAMSGTHAEQQGADPTALLGHTDRRTTQRYLRDRSPRVVTGPSIGRPIDSKAKS